VPGNAVYFAVSFELGQWLRRRIWQALRRMKDTFHPLPIIAAIMTFLLLAYDGQVREIYLSYLEALNEQGASGIGLHFGTTVGAYLAALAGVTLISATLSEAHYALSTTRIGFIYSNLSNPEFGSRLRSIQRLAAVILVLVPWLGLAAGLFHAKDYVSDLYPRLQLAGFESGQITAIQTLLPKIETLSIVITLAFAALVASFVIDHYRREPIVQGAMIAVAPFATIGLFLLLIDWGPQELGGDEIVVVALMAGIALAAYYLGYYRLCARPSTFVYAHAWIRDTGINLRRRRRLVGLVWANLPWLVLALCLALAGHSNESVTPATAIPLAGRSTVFTLAMTWVLGTGLVVAALMDALRESLAAQRAIVAAVAVLMVAALLATTLESDEIVRAYRWIGPLASLSLTLLFVIAALAMLAVLSQQSGFPALTLVLLTIVASVLFPVPITVSATVLTIVCGLFAVMALLSRLWAVATVAALLAIPGITTWIDKLRTDDILQNPDRVGPPLNENFREWLRLRPDRASYEGHYPVFIVALQGGGIYATATASLFLAGLEDANPGFSQHVFAISGVSGGAVGAAVFQALAHSRLTQGAQHPSSAVLAQPTRGVSPPPECRRNAQAAPRPATRQPLSQLVSKVMRDDHFSPVIGAIFPDVVGVSAPGRPKMLADSFESSVNSIDVDAARRLCSPFKDHWSVGGEVPALVLNSTWAETGFRVAFAPFGLHGDDDFLYSFSDQFMPDVSKTTLIEAAVVSARFPGILPPFSLLIKDQKLRWNFVDGAYSDSTGSSTALTLYRALKSEPGAEIKLILLTSSNPQPDLSPDTVLIKGTEFRDTLAPIAAVLNVREGLGNQAVARVCEEFHKAGDCKGQSNRRESALKIVGINDAIYALPLGWKLSDTTFEVVRSMLGDAHRCTKENESVLRRGSINKAWKVESGARAEDQKPGLSKETLDGNSCVLKFVSDLLKRPQAP